MPERIQRKRTKGWRMPANTVSVCRPGRWGNPYIVGKDGDAKACVDKFYAAIMDDSILDYLAENFENSGNQMGIWSVYDWLDPLKGKNLACWCKVGMPCHADK